MTKLILRSFVLHYFNAEIKLKEVLKYEIKLIVKGIFENKILLLFIESAFKSGLF